MTPPAIVPAFITEALQRLQVEKLVLGVHDLMLPAFPQEDTGRGAPMSQGALAFVDLCRSLGFDAIQLGPQGDTAADNPSPYDGSIFARNRASIALWPLTQAQDGALLTAPEIEAFAAQVPIPDDRAHHAYALDVNRSALTLARARLQAADTPERQVLGAAFTRFRAAAAPWLDRDGLFFALADAHQVADPERWPESDQRLWDPEDVAAAAARRAGLRATHADLLDAYAFAQFLAHRQHAQFHEALAARGMLLLGDLQIGLAPRDRWAWRRFFLEDWVMGAPPSRTTPDGQPWGYPVLDPRLTSRRFAGPHPPAMEFVRLRLDKALQEYDGLRIDHPHGWVCPWVYAAADRGSAAAVNVGTRLFESPDLPGFFEQLAITRFEQLRPDRPRFDDEWVRELDEAQVGLYAELADEILASAQRAGRPAARILWELLSTQPYPLERVLRRQSLGRFRVTQKVRLEDPSDGYRSELAKPQDWVMVGNHDTLPIWAVAQRWQRDGELPARAAYLAERLRPESDRARFAALLTAQLPLLVQAQFADLFASRARQVLVFVSDMLGEHRPYNLPGVVDAGNWTLRVPRAYEADYAAKRRRAQALDMPLVLALALEAPGAVETPSEDLVRALRAAASPESVALIWPKPA